MAKSSFLALARANLVSFKVLRCDLHVAKAGALLINMPRTQRFVLRFTKVR